MLVVNVNNSQKMPVWDILRPYIDACANTLPSCCSRMHNLLDNTFHERFRPKKFSIPYSGNKNNTPTKKQAAISSFISRIFISHCLAGISCFSHAIFCSAHGQTFVACKVLGNIKSRCTNKTQLVSDTLFTWPQVCYVGILNNKTGAILVSQSCIVGVQLFSYAIASFCFQYICIAAGHVSKSALFITHCRSSARCFLSEK